MREKENIALAESQLKELIQDSVRMVLEARAKNLLLEMPYPRGIYKEKIDALLPQVFTNWCLVHYRTITGTQQYKKHWKGEVRGHLYTISRLSLKGGDDLQKRSKVLNEILNENDYNLPQFMTLTICNKFIEEKIDVKSPQFAQTILDCIENIQRIFQLILDRNIDEIDKYVETI